MKHILLALLVIGSLPSLSPARWAFVPLDELIQDSDLIVIGTLMDVSEHSKKGMDYGQGTIIVDEVIWGSASPGEMLTLRWQNRSEMICPRVEHRGNENKKGIWLLTIGKNHEVQANYPGRFVELKERKKVERMLQKKKVCVRAHEYVTLPDDPIHISFVFRNPTQSQQQFPGLEYRDGCLYLNPDVELTLVSGWEEEAKQVSPLPDRVIVSENIAPIFVEAGQENRIILDLKTLFEIVPDQVYSLQFKVKGYEPGNGIKLYALGPDSLKDYEDISGIEDATAATQDSKTGFPPGLFLGAIGMTISLLVFIQYRTKRHNRAQKQGIG